MLGLIDVVWCPNPLRPVGDRQVRRLLLTGTDTVDSVVHRLALHGTPLQATLNGAELARRRWGRKRVHAGDVLVLRQLAKGVEVGAAAGAAATAKGAGAYAALIAAVVTIAVNVAISLAISALINSLTKKDGASSGGNKDTSPAGYGIEGGSNTARAYEPLALVLGEHRLFPDYASRPFTEFVLDPTTATEVINNDVTTVDVPVPPFGFDVTETGGNNGTPITKTRKVWAPWVLTGTVTQEVGKTVIEYYADTAARSYIRPDSFGLLQGGAVTMPHTFAIRYIEKQIGTPGQPETPEKAEVTTWEETEKPAESQTWHPLNSSTTLPVIQRYGYTAIYNTERLASIFNFGFGDLDVSDLRIGASVLANFSGVTRNDSEVPPGDGSRTVLTGYTTKDWADTTYPGNVQSVDGAKLEQSPETLNGGWIERNGSEACRRVQIDIAGRLFKQVSGGVVGATCTMEAEYQAVDSDAWVAFPFSPWTIFSGASTPVRNTYGLHLEVKMIKVRVRRTTPDSTDASVISELEWSRLKFFRDGDALYPAQHRMGLLIKATGQLNGRIERLSCMVRAKHWQWAAGAHWEPGAYPGVVSGAWTWGETVNPAWLFLYYARGGFLNPTAAPSHLGHAGWLDQPAVGNGERLFGAGLINERIDYAVIVAWGHFCDAAGLSCRMAIMSQRSAGEVLDDIAAAGRATKTWATGKLGVVWEAPGQPVVAAFGMSNIVAGTFGVSYSTDTSVDEFALNYTRTDADFEADTVYAAVPGMRLPVNQRTEQAVYSMPRVQAQRLVNLLAASRHYHRRTIKWEASLLGLAVQRGDIVHLANDLTRWAASGRLVGLVAEGGQVQQVTLSAEVDNPSSAGAFFLWICEPGGDYQSVLCTAPTTRTRTLKVLGYWSAIDAPGWLGAGADSHNILSRWPDSGPEDWTFLAGPTATPGKRVRIINMEPTNARQVRITARDEEPAYYPLEWSLINPPEPAIGEQPVARAYNLSATARAEGGIQLAWELEGAHGADVTVNIAAPGQQSMQQGILTVAGNQLLIPSYGPGTVISASITPITAGTPARAEGDGLTFTV